MQAARLRGASAWQAGMQLLKQGIEVAKNNSVRENCNQDGDARSASLLFHYAKLILPCKPCSPALRMRRRRFVHSARGLRRRIKMISPR